MLNAFGGIKDVFSTLKLIKKAEFKKYDKYYNIFFFADVNEDFMMVKYSGRINESLRKFLKKSTKSQANEKELRKLNKSRGTFSSIPIAAAMSAYARMSINKHKNIDGNLCVYSNTDSVIFTKPLDPMFRFFEIGQFKLEQIITKAIFIRTKLYAFYSDSKKLIIKSSGVKPSKLN